MLRIAGYRLDTASGPQEAWSRLTQRRYAAILLDMNFSVGAADGEEGLACLRRIVADDPQACVVVITAHSGIRIAVAAMQAGARDFVMKPWRNADLVAKLEAAMVRRPVTAPVPARQVAGAPAVLIGESGAMQELRALIRRVGPTIAGVTVTGPAGSGRTLVAQAIYVASPDATDLAHRIDLRRNDHLARVGEATGTIILRHADQLDRLAQETLLDHLPPGVRCIAIAASVETLVPALRRRVATVEVAVPPLAARGEDAVLLARHFVRVAADRFGKPGAALTPAAEAVVRAIRWGDEVRGLAFAVERAGKLDAQREVGRDGTRAAARIGEQRRQADNAGFAEGAGAAGVSVREAARLDSFIQALSRTAGNQVDMAEGGAPGIADRARNERLGRIIDSERLTRMQGLLHDHGVELSRRQIAMDQNGDLNLNLTPQTAAAMWKAGLINESQLGAVANGGRARFSFAHNDLLVSSSTGFSRSARNDTSTRFEAGKQAGPDTIEHFLGGGTEGHAAMTNWLRGGFEMDRKGNWRLKPQVADTIQRDVQAVMAQTGWQRGLNRSAEHSASLATSVSGNIRASASRGVGSGSGPQQKLGGRIDGQASGSVGIESVDRGATLDTANASLDIGNYNVREAISIAERAAAHANNPAAAFTKKLGEEILGTDGLRNRYLEQADAARGILDPSAPITSFEQSSILRTGRMSLDPAGGPTDGNSSFKSRRDQ